MNIDQQAADAIFVHALVQERSAITAGVGQFAVIQSVASSVGVDVSPVNLRDAGEIERAVAAFARSANGGLVVTAGAWSLVHHELIIALAARHKLPTVYCRFRKLHPLG